MPRLYMDVHVPIAVTFGLRLRNVDVLTAQEDGTATVLDPELLDRATSLGRLLFTQDDDLLAEATRRQRAGEHFGGVLFVHQRDLTIGRCVEDLELIAKASTPEEWEDQVVYLPLRS
jgi:predicted nuclease of predicted toxin-antitoxin system